MNKELFFDFVSEDGSGAVEKLAGAEKPDQYQYQYTSSDLENDKIQITNKAFDSFEAFWTAFIQNKYWYCLHPLFIHPEWRAFIKEKLKKVNWSLVEDEKWREMYQRQWNKVLTAPATYYRPL